MAYTGTCIRCGLCCQCWIPQPHGYMVADCEYLVWEGEPGNPNGARCTAYGHKLTGMPIRLKHLGQFVGQTICLSSYPRAIDAVPPQCSYKWDGNGEQPKWYEGYTPVINSWEV